MSTLSLGGQSIEGVLIALDLPLLFISNGNTLNDLLSVNGEMFSGDVGPGGPQFQHSFTILLFS